MAIRQKVLPGRYCYEGVEDGGLYIFDTRLMKGRIIPHRGAAVDFTPDKEDTKKLAKKILQYGEFVQGVAV